jgi:hypothetical protein
MFHHNNDDGETKYLTLDELRAASAAFVKRRRDEKRQQTRQAIDRARAALAKAAEDLERGETPPPSPCRYRW